MDKALIITIHGRVQGVGFRHFTLRAALENNIYGYVKNLPDGEVEIFCQADEESIKEFIFLIKKGPSFSFITKTLISNCSVDNNIKSFEIKY